jgi:hypothetical protein
MLSVAAERHDVHADGSGGDLPDRVDRVDGS